MLPIALRAGGRRALIVGGGNVALRKAHAVLEAGFALIVVAPSILPALRALLGDGNARERIYAATDLEGIDLVIAATDSPEVNAAVVAGARAARVLCSDASDPERGDFTMQTIVRVGDLTFTVDSGGSSPAFAARIARELRERFGPEYDAAARTLTRMRTYVRTVLDEARRAPVLRELAERAVSELARMNPVEAEHEVEETISRVHGSERADTPSVVCASRASTLAMTQTRLVAAKLAARGIATTILNVTTTGDREQDKPVDQLGTVNVWVKELEVALRDGRAHYAVHSCKDLPGELAPDMRLAAISQREDPRDAFCSERYASFDALPPGAVVGTSSPRRRAQLRALRSDLRYEDMRGNVDTRLRKLREGAFDAIVLAMAGLQRLGARATYTTAFDTRVLVPAVAQGALAVETLASNEALAEELHAAINHEPSQRCVEAERATLRSLRAGCSAPLGVYAYLEGARMTIEAAYARGDGRMVRESMTADVMTLEAARELGARLAAALAPVSVLLPRTQDRPSRIAEQLRGHGVEVLELREGESDEHLKKAIPSMLLFPSSGSVAAASSYLAWLRTQAARPLVAAMGPQSGEAARAAGFAPDIVAPEASVDAFVAAIATRLERA